MRIAINSTERSSLMVLEGEREGRVIYEHGGVGVKRYSPHCIMDHSQMYTRHKEMEQWTKNSDELVDTVVFFVSLSDCW